MKILLTGSSGLLGAEIADMAKDRAVQATGVCRRPLHSGDIAADLCDPGGLERIAAADFDCIVHAAAWRDPDLCEKNKEECRRINVKATEALAEIAKKKRAFFLYISTDYVFAGDSPPYSEDARPNPVNYYGKTKAEAEGVVSTLADFAILRVPLLYGLAAGLEKCPILLLMLKALSSRRRWGMEDSIARFPTFTGDVASAVFFLLERKARGVFHLSSGRKTTRYGMTLEFAEIMGLDSSHIVPIAKPSSSEATRPLNSQLSMEKLLKLGFEEPLAFSQRIRLLKPQIESAIDNLKNK